MRKGCRRRLGTILFGAFLQNRLGNMYTIACAAFSKNLSKISCPEPPSPPFPHGIPPSICNHKDILFGAFAKTHCQYVYYCLRRFLKKSLKNLLPGAALSTLSERHTVLNMRSRGCPFRCFFAKLLCRYATAGSIHFAFLRLGMIFPDAVFCYFMPDRPGKNATEKRSKAPFS